MELYGLPWCLEGRQDLERDFEGVVPRLQLFLGLTFCRTVLVEAPEPHGKIVGFLQHRVLAEENRSPYLLGDGPRAPRREQQRATSCQSRLGGIPILVTGGLVAASTFPSRFALGVVCRDGRLA